MGHYFIVSVIVVTLTSTLYGPVHYAKHHCLLSLNFLISVSNEYCNIY